MSEWLLYHVYNFPTWQPNPGGAQTCNAKTLEERGISWCIRSGWASDLCSNRGSDNSHAFKADFLLWFPGGCPSGSNQLMEVDNDGGQRSTQKNTERKEKSLSYCHSRSILLSPPSLRIEDIVIGNDVTFAVKCSWIDVVDECTISSFDIKLIPGLWKK